jgi:hypothetical protein
VIVSFNKEIKRRTHSSDSNFSEVSQYMLDNVIKLLEKNHALVSIGDVTFSHSQMWTEYLDTISQDYQNLEVCSYCILSIKDIGV